MSDRLMNSSVRLKFLTSALSLFALLILFGCSNNSQFSNADRGSTEEVSAAAPAESEGGEPAPTPANEETVTIETINKVEPSLAVRATSCLLCHADVKGSIMTDLGGGKNTSEIYIGAQVAQSWGSMSLNGKVIVPKLKLSESDSLKSLVSALAPSSSSVVEVSKLKISAPTAQQIRERAGLSSSVKTKNLPSGTTQNAEGLVEIKNAFTCDTDIVIDGFVHLVSSKITTNSGCRIYATGAIFVSKGVDIQGGANRNLQLISSTGIYIGMSASSISSRLSHLNGRGGLSSTKDAALISALNLGYSQASKVSGLIDADSQSSTASFERVLVNAPSVQSREHGSFKGFVIADFAAFRIGELQFEFDPVFKNVALMPLTGISTSLEVVP